MIVVALATRCFEHVISMSLVCFSSCLPIVRKAENYSDCMAAEPPLGSPPPCVRARGPCSWFRETRRRRAGTVQPRSTGVAQATTSCSPTPLRNQLVCIKPCANQHVRLRANLREGNRRRQGERRAVATASVKLPAPRSKFVGVMRSSI